MSPEAQAPYKCLLWLPQDVARVFIIQVDCQDGKLLYSGERDKKGKQTNERANEVWSSCLFGKVLITY